jgi:3-oxoacyl-[acyl-carrier protein] reductase
MGNYVIVGGTTGIGASLCIIMAEASHQVFVYARNRHELPNHPNIHFQELDIIAENPVFENLPDNISGLAYCPGSISLLPFHRIKKQQFQDDFNINVLGAIASIQACYNGLKANGNASVVLFSTVAVQTGMSFHTSIAASKGAIEGLTKSLAAEYASAGIRFNAIAPSLTDTPLAAKLLASEEKKEASNKRHPLGRYGTSEDIAAAAAFLLQDKATWITGQILGVDGGMGSLRMI